MAKRPRTSAERAADKQRTGRPPMGDDEKHSEQLMVYLTKKERAMLETLAKKEGVSLAALIMRPWREQESE